MSESSDKYTQYRQLSDQLMHFIYQWIQEESKEIDSEKLSRLVYLIEDLDGAIYQIGVKLVCASHFYTEEQKQQIERGK